MSMTTSVFQAKTKASCLEIARLFHFFVGHFNIPHFTPSSWQTFEMYVLICQMKELKFWKVRQAAQGHATRVAELGAEPLIRLQGAHSSHNPMEILPSELAARYFSLSHCRLPALLSSQFVLVQCLSNIKVHTNHLGLLNCRALFRRSGVGPELQVLRWSLCC